MTTVNELREMLDQFDGEDEIVYTFPSGNYWNDEIAVEPKYIDYGHVKYSNYNDSDILVDEDDVTEDSNEDFRTVVVMN
jgi:hypothetical protein